MPRPQRRIGAQSRKHRIAEMEYQLELYRSAGCPYAHVIIRVQGADEPELPAYTDTCPHCSAAIFDLVYAESTPPPGFEEERQRRAEANDFWLEANGMGLKR